MIRFSTNRLAMFLSATLFASCVLIASGCEEQDGESRAESSSNSENQADDSDTPEVETQLVAATGILVGEVGPSTAFVQVRLSASNELVDRTIAGAEGIAVFSLREKDDPTAEAIEIEVTALPENDFIARAAFTDLEPNTTYVCSTRLGADDEQLADGPTAEFRTLAGSEISRPIKFVVVTGMNYAKFHGDNRIDRQKHVEQNNTELPEPYEGNDKALGYPALQSILGLAPDFFIGTGDNVYYDSPFEGRATTIDEMRQRWHEQFIQPRYHELFAKVPTYWEVDDHDYRKDDCDNSGDYLPTTDDARKVLFEQLPYGPMNDADVRSFRTHRLSKEVQIWLPENRLHRSPNLTEDGEAKSIWGEEQSAWLRESIAASDAPFKIMVSPTPMIGPDDLRKKDNHTNVGGFQYERDAFFDWLKSAGLDGDRFFFACGDRHWQYHSVHPSGFQEFSCGALVDANSRLGRKPGDPQSTDPDGEIEQPYYQTPASGGFLMIGCDPEEEGPLTLRFEWFDEQGELLHTHEQVAADESSP